MSEIPWKLIDVIGIKTYSLKLSDGIRVLGWSLLHQSVITTVEKLLFR